MDYAVQLENELAVSQLECKEKKESMSKWQSDDNNQFILKSIIDIIIDKLNALANQINIQMNTRVQKREKY